MKNDREIETDRLILKVPTMDEQYELWKILKDEKVNQYYMPTPSRYNNNRKEFLNDLQNWEMQKKFYEYKINNLDDDANKYTWSIFLKNGEVIGQMTVQPAKEKVNPTGDKGIRDVGWYINPKYQGQGLAYEAAKAIISYMFKKVKIKAIKTSAAQINPASWKLMEKLGMIRIGEEMSSYLDNNGNEIPGYRYELTRERYVEKNNEGEIE